MTTPSADHIRQIMADLQSDDHVRIESALYVCSRYGHELSTAAPAIVKLVQAAPDRTLRFAAGRTLLHLPMSKVIDAVVEALPAETRQQVCNHCERSAQREIREAALHGYGTNLGEAKQAYFVEELIASMLPVQDDRWAFYDFNRAS